MHIANTEHRILRHNLFSGLLQLLLRIRILGGKEYAVIIWLLIVHFLIIFWRHVEIVPHIILTDMLDLYFFISILLILDVDAVPHFYIQQFGGLLAYDRPLIR